jgi:hypothetical protein
MIGKASEIQIIEMWHRHFEKWKENNPDVMIIDIKYALGNDNDAALLIIYKESESK